METGFTKEYDLKCHVTESAGIGMGYIKLSNEPHGKCIDLSESHGLVIDVDKEGRLIGIEVFDHKMLPPEES